MTVGRQAEYFAGLDPAGSSWHVGLTEAQHEIEELMLQREITGSLRPFVAAGVRRAGASSRSVGAPRRGVTGVEMVRAVLRRDLPYTVEELSGSFGRHKTVRQRAILDHLAVVVAARNLNSRTVAELLGCSTRSSERLRSRGDVMLRDLVEKLEANNEKLDAILAYLKAAHPTDADIAETVEAFLADVRLAA